MLFAFIQSFWFAQSQNKEKLVTLNAIVVV